jgi:DEAD/DEAH box helicase domain-containing protein
MKKLPVILDLETQKKFSEVNDHRDLGVSLVGIYDYNTKKYSAYLESELPKLFKILENSSYIVGFNIASFDFPVLQEYYPGKLSNLSIFDILDDLREKIGKRFSLNYFSFATLGKKKSGHGLQAVDFYRDGDIEALKKYCLKDVELTKELFEYGIEHGQIFYLNEVGKVPVIVEWKKYLSEQNKKDTPLTLPF